MKVLSKRITALLLCLMLVLSVAFVGCSKNNDNENSNTTNQNDTKNDKNNSSNDKNDSENDKNNSKDEENKENNEPEVIDKMGKYEEPVVLTTIAGRDTAGGDFDKYKDPDETFENNRWVKLLKEKLNIEIKYDAIVDQSQLDQKRKIMVASGSIPDFFATNDVEVSQLNKAEAIQPVGDIFDKYKSDLIASLYDLGGNSIWVPTTLKGKRMAIPNVGAGEAMNQAKFLWIRRDWLNNLGLEEPKTLEDIIDVATKFTNDDPDQNGENDTYGIGLTSDISSTRSFITGIFNSYGVHPYIWLKDNSDELYYGLLDPKVKDALAGMRDLYKSGVFDLEFAIKDMAKLKEDLSSGKVGIVSGFHATALQLAFNSVKENDPDTDFVALQLPEKTTIPADNPAVVVISSDCENPEAVVKIMNLGAEMYYKSNEEDRNYYIQNEHGLPGLTLFPAPQPLVVGKNPKNAALISEAIEKGIDDPEAFYETKDTLVPKGDFLSVYGHVTGWANDKDTAKYPWYLLFGPGGVELELGDVAAKGNYVQDAFMGAPTETMVKKKEVLIKLQDEALLRIIMGEDNLDAYDKLVDDWKKLGGQQITDEVNSWVSENQ